MQTYEALMLRLEEMRGHLKGGFSSVEQTEIVELYMAVLGKRVKNLSCGDCYRDAFIEIFTHLKSLGKMPTQPRYVLKTGEFLHEFGTSEYYSNPLPDEIAEKFLKLNPSLITIFDTFPEDWDANNEEAAPKKRGRKPNK